MNCSFIAYPAEPEHKNVLEVFREPVGRKNCEGSADLRGTKKHPKQIQLKKMEMAGSFKGSDPVMRKGVNKFFNRHIV